MEVTQSEHHSTSTVNSTTQQDSNDQKANDTAKAQEQHQAGKNALSELTQPIRGWLLLGRILSGASAVLALAPYIALVNLGGIFVAAASSGTPVNKQATKSLILILIGTFIGRLFLYFMALNVTHFADAAMGRHIRERMIHTLGKAPLSYFSSSSTGAIRKSIQDDTHTLHGLVAHAPVESTSAIVMPIALFIYACIIDWRLGILSIATVPLYYILEMFTMKDMGPKTAQMDSKLGRVSSTMVEFVNGITVVKAFGQVGRAHKNYRVAADEFSDFYLAWCKPLLNGAAAAQSAIATPVLLLINLGVGSLFVSQGWVSAVQVLTTALIALVIPSAIEVAGNTSWSYQLAGAAALRLKQVLNTATLAVSDQHDHPQGYRVRFDHVSYSYGDVMALNNISLDIPEGKTTALIGPSGSGKSTLATLIARFADPNSGTVSIGGANVAQMDSNELYRSVSFVLQDAQLLRMSIRDNIALSRPDIDLESIRSAAKAAHIDNEIMALPHGYDTIVGQEIALSGGQEQRISIARALVVDAPILILDEATAAVDPESEALIQDALDTLMHKRTVIVIAHKLTSIVGAEQIVILEHGSITARGTHEELVNEPHFAALAASAAADNTKEAM